MKKFFLSFLLMTVSLNVFAEWTYVTSSFDGDKYYVDFSTKKVNNGIVKIWIQTIYNSISKYGDYGNRTQVEFDCNNDLHRFRYLIFYKDIEFNNISETDSKVGEWKPIPPESTVSVILRKVCIN